jgi:hypothetical protein
MLHLDSLLGAGTKIGGVLSTLQVLAPRDDTLVLHSGGRTQDQGTKKLSNEGAMASLLDFRSKG